MKDERLRKDEFDQVLIHFKAITTEWFFWLITKYLEQFEQTDDLVRECREKDLLKKLEKRVKFNFFLGIWVSTANFLETPISYWPACPRLSKCMFFPVFFHGSNSGARNLNNCRFDAIFPTYLLSRFGLTKL